MALTVRPRTGTDLAALLALLRRTHDTDGYPVRQEAVSDWWLASPDELWSAVAETDVVVGHVALHPADGTAVPLWEQATGRPAVELAVVSRLFTDRTTAGAGTALLGAAVAEARRTGRAPVLLVDPDSPARGFYRRRGWAEVGTARQQWGPRTVDAALFVAPGVTAPPAVR